MMYLKSKKIRFVITRHTLHHQEAHFGYAYDVYDKKNGTMIMDHGTKQELKMLRKKLRF